MFSLIREFKKYPSGQTISFIKKTEINVYYFLLINSLGIAPPFALHNCSADIITTI